MGVKVARNYRYLTGNIEPALSRPQEVRQKKHPDDHGELRCIIFIKPQTGRISLLVTKGEHLGLCVILEHVDLMDSTLIKPATHSPKIESMFSCVWLCELGCSCLGDRGQDCCFLFGTEVS